MVHRSALCVLLLSVVGCDRSVREIVVTGEGFHWHFTTAGKDGQLGTDDDLTSFREIELTVAQPVRFLVQSKDFLYIFRSDALGIHEVAVPDLSFEVMVTPDKPGRFSLPVDPMCGFNFLHQNKNMGLITVMADH